MTDINLKVTPPSIISIAGDIDSGITISETSGSSNGPVQTHEPALKANYTTGDLDSESEIITALNLTNTTINSIVTKLEALGLFATS